MSERIVTDEDFQILKRLEEYKRGQAYPSSPDSWQTIIDQVHNLIEKLYEYQNYKMKIENDGRRKSKTSNVVVMHRDGSIWKSDNVPIGMETEAIIRLLNSSAAHDLRDFYMLPVYIRSTELRMPSDVVMDDRLDACMSFRKINQLSYKR